MVRGSASIIGRYTWQCSDGGDGDGDDDDEEEQKDDCNRDNHHGDDVNGNSVGTFQPYFER